VLDFLAAMMNDYAESQNWQIRYTGRELGRDLSWQEFQQVQELVMDLVTSAISSGDEEAPDEEASKN